MGEMADFYNEQIEEMEYQRDLYRMGYMPIDEATEKGIIDEYGNDSGNGVRSPYKTCKSCGDDKLRWGFSKKYQKWLLYSLGGAIHKCKQNITCKICQKTKLYWNQAENGEWKLFKKGHAHKCIKKRILMG